MKDLSIKHKSYGIFTILLLVIFVSGTVILHSLSMAKEDAEIINALGRQRVLAQEMAQSVFGFYMSKNQKKILEQQIGYLDAYITEMRKTYTESVIDKVDIPLSMNPAAEPHPAIPFPATFTRMVNESFLDREGFSATIISENPVNPNQTLKSELDKEANDFLKKSSAPFFSKIIEEDGKLSFRLYSKDKATATACASCHSVLQNKKVKVGDILGIRSYQMVYSENISLGKAELNANLDQYNIVKTMFEFTLLVMKLGGYMPQDRNLTQWKKVHAIQDANAQNKILEIEKEFRVLVEAVKTILDLKTNSIPDRLARQAIITQANKLGILSNDLTYIFEKIAKKHQRNIQLAVAITGTFSFLTLICLAFYMGSTVISPVQKISKILTETAKGNLEQKVLTVKSKDEIGVLNQSCNRLVEGLRRFIRYSEDILNGKGLSLPITLEGDFKTSIESMNTTQKNKQHAEEKLRHAYDDLEIRIKERTSKLSESNESLKNEILERKRAEDLATRFGRILDNSSNEIYIFNEHNLKFVKVNYGARKNLGYSEGELSLLTPLDLNQEFTMEQFGALIQPLREGKQSQLVFETVHKRKDGSLYPVEVLLQLSTTESLPLFVAIIQDISERNKTEALLSQLHRQNELILSSAAEGIYGLDLEGNTTFINPAAAKMIGYESEELIGKAQHALIHHSKPDGSPYPREECPIYAAFKDGEVRHTTDEVFWKKDGSSFPVEYTSTPIMDEDKIIGAVVTFNDISRQKLLQAQLTHAQKMESIGQLAAGMAHEINTPMQFIGDNTRFLEDSFRQLFGTIDAHDRLRKEGKSGTVSEKTIEEVEASLETNDMDYLSEEIPLAIKQSLEGVKRVTDIVKAMKEFSHPGSEEKFPMDLTQAIESTLTVARNEWKYFADVVTDFDPDLPPVHCLVNDFNQVILNTVVNAAHAIENVVKNSGDKGTITISTRKDGDWAEICIKDTGSGIPEDIRPKIFDPFFTTKEMGKGTGQGLPIIHSVIVNKHNGTVDLETEEGKGTTFIFRLPIFPSEV